MERLRHIGQAMVYSEGEALEVVKTLIIGETLQLPLPRADIAAKSQLASRLTISTTHRQYQTVQGWVQMQN